HLEEFAGRTRQMLREHGLQDRATVQDAPLAPVPVGAGTYEWYALSALEGMTEVGFVVVDGPPKATGPDARYPAVPLLVEHLADEAWIVVDDADRPDEAHAVERWLTEVPGLEQLPSPTDELAVLHYVRGSARPGSAARTPAT
ncbi:class I SAM-dependent methyltransferase, partial [Georgenia sp. 10Sc9-8]|nr:class I SAM-dependent methyltransferase [Georgenia halotolerans]